MATRRDLIDAGGRLRCVELFSDLSLAEATVLGTFFERRAVETGAVIIRQSEFGDELYLIEVGHAQVRVHTHAGDSHVLATLGRGDYFGEIAVISGTRRTADVVAISSMTILMLTRTNYSKYLEHMVNVQQQMARTAATRIAEVLQREREGL
jgi:CRP-like cAMP-binding protein